MPINKFSIEEYHKLKYFTVNGTQHSIDRSFEQKLEYLSEKINNNDHTRLSVDERRDYFIIIQTIKHITKTFIQLCRKQPFVSPEDDDTMVLSYFIDKSLLVYVKYPEFDLDKYVYHRYKQNAYIEDIRFSNVLRDAIEYMFWSVVNRFDEIEFDLSINVIQITPETQTPRPSTPTDTPINTPTID